MGNYLNSQLNLMNKKIKKYSKYLIPISIIGASLYTITNEKNTYNPTQSLDDEYLQYRSEKQDEQQIQHNIRPRWTLPDTYIDVTRDAFLGEGLRKLKHKHKHLIYLSINK